MGVSSPLRTTPSDGFGSASSRAPAYAASSNLVDDLEAELASALSEPAPSARSGRSVMPGALTSPGFAPDAASSRSVVAPSSPGFYGSSSASLPLRVGPAAQPTPQQGPYGAPLRYDVGAPSPLRAGPAGGAGSSSSRTPAAVGNPIDDLEAELMSALSEPAPSARSGRGVMHGVPSSPGAAAAHFNRSTVAPSSPGFYGGSNATAPVSPHHGGATSAASQSAQGRYGAPSRYDVGASPPLRTGPVGGISGASSRTPAPAAASNPLDDLEAELFSALSQQ